ncbi:MAG: hypothetical protein KY428_12155 [Bacteroidetes bacterium]|nr:hypothetical protein [Bacteroidota bacterium]
MEPEKQPTEMILDQIELLRSEERKLKKFVNYNREAKSTIDIHLEEIRKKKNKLYKLCDIMGIERKEEREEESVNSMQIPQPTGRFGSALINWQK